MGRSTGSPTSPRKSPRKKTQSKQKQASAQKVVAPTKISRTLLKDAEKIHDCGSTSGGGRAKKV